jgi:hypothetical protein
LKRAAWLLTISMLASCGFDDDPPRTAPPHDACASCGSDAPPGDAAADAGDGPKAPIDAWDAAPEAPGQDAQDARDAPDPKDARDSHDQAGDTSADTWDGAPDVTDAGGGDAGPEAPAPSEPCSPRALPFNDARAFMFQNKPPACMPAADGEFVMQYEPEQKPAWVSCVFASGLPRDYLSRPGDVLEVTYCLSAPTPGQLAVWYELTRPEGDARFPIPLFPASKVAAPGCYRHYVDVASACPADCRAAMATATGAQFAFVGEYRESQRSAAEPALGARLVSIRKYQGSCACLQEADCGAPAPACSAADPRVPFRLADPRCAASGSCAGLCRDRALDDGEGAVGRYASGVNPEVTPAFRASYQRLGAQLGRPGCPAQTDDAPAECKPCNEVGGACPTPYLFELGGVLAQRFFQPSKQQRMSPNDPGWSVLVLRRSAGKTFSVRWPFLQLYQCMRSRGAPEAGPALLGLPIEDAWTDGATLRQSFERGDLALLGGELAINATGATGDLDLDACTPALDPVRARLKPRGGSEIILFSFATGSEGLKADPVPGKPGDVSSGAMVKWAMNEGDLNPGAADLTIGFSDRSQSANFLIQDLGSPKDLTGMTLFTRVKVTSGFSASASLPGGLTLLVYDQSYRNCYSTWTNVEQGGVWKEYSFDLSTCAGQPAELTRIRSYGLRFDTNSGDTAASQKPTEARILVDTVGYRATP